MLKRLSSCEDKAVPFSFTLGEKLERESRKQRGKMVGVITACKKEEHFFQHSSRHLVSFKLTVLKERYTAAKHRKKSLRISRGMMNQFCSGTATGWCDYSSIEL